MEEDSSRDTVSIDGDGRITIPESIRTRLGLEAGDRLLVDDENGVIRLRTPFEPVESGKDDFGSEAFPDAGEALFGEISGGNDASERNTTRSRQNHPSGFLALTKHESVPILVDALLDLPPGREINKTEFADHAGVTRQTVSTHIDLLLELDVVEEVPNTSPQRYRLAESDVVQELFEVNSALNAVED